MTEKLNEIRERHDEETKDETNGLQKGRAYRIAHQDRGYLLERITELERELQGYVDDNLSQLADNTRLRKNMKKMIERWRRQMIERWRKEMIDQRGYEDCANQLEQALEDE